MVAVVILAVGFVTAIATVLAAAFFGIISYKDEAEILRKEALLNKLHKHKKRTRWVK